MAFTLTHRLLLVAVLVAALLALGSSAHDCDNDCTSCSFGVCLGCKAGHYLEGGECQQCHSNHCQQCRTREQCIVCEPGYHLRYVAGPSGESLGAYGRCVDAASSVTGHVTLIAVGVALVFTVWGV